jgi:membrane protease YdiL (CAAX protease family)
MSEPEQPPPPVEARPETPPPEPPVFWSYSDLFLFVGLALPSILAGVLLVRAFALMLPPAARIRVLELLGAQFLGYGILFGFLWLLFRFHYGRPFWRPLGWVRAPLRDSAVVLWGVVLALAVAFASLVLKTPDLETPMKQLLSDRTSVLLVAVFGITLGPLCEELAFRGFMQPLLVRSLGAAPGVILAAVPFGLLHLQQYGFSWRHGLLITAAGAGFGWMRHRSGSTRASTIMHAAYNTTFFLALLAQRKDLPHTW